MLVLFALILRAVSLEFRAHDPARKGLWEAVFVGSSFLPALLFGVALGNVVAGVPLDARTEFAGTFFTLLRPWPLAFGVLGLCVFLLHGSAYAALKTEGAVSRAGPERRPGSWPARRVFAALFAAFLARPGLSSPRRRQAFPPGSIGTRLPVSASSSSSPPRKGRDGRAVLFLRRPSSRPLGRRRRRSTTRTWSGPRTRP